jgi:hypothetical protein
VVKARTSKEEVCLLKKKRSTVYNRVDYKSLPNATWKIVFGYDFNDYFFRDEFDKVKSVPKRRVKFLNVDMSGRKENAMTVLNFPIHAKISVENSIKVLEYRQLLTT